MALKRTGLAILLALAASLMTGCNVGDASVADSQSDEALIALPVQVATPARTDLFATYHTTAALTSDAEAPVLAKVAGEVRQVLVEEGDSVEAGQILAQLDGERLRLEMVHAKAVLDRTNNDYQRNVHLHEKNLVSASAIEGLRYDLEGLNASHELKKLLYGYTKIRAPISGVISSRDVKLGQHVGANEGTFRITETTRLVAYLQIPQGELAKFSAGHVSEVRVDAMPGQVFTAVIARISPTVDTKTGTFRATAYLDNKDGQLAPGMFGRFNIAYEKHGDTLTVPAMAVVNEDNEAVVYVVEQDAAVRRLVKTGIESGGLVEILEGLVGDEMIVVSGQGSLRDGSKVLASARAEGPVIG